MGGTPRRAPEEVDFTSQTGHLEHSLAGRSKPQFGLLRACTWLLQAAYCARVGTSRRKKCESEYTSRKKVRNIPSKYEQTGRARDTFDKLSLQGLKKGAGARYIRHFLFSRQEKRGGRTIHSTIFAFKARKKEAGARYIRQIVPSGPSRGVPSWGGPHGEPRRGRFHDSNGPSGALSGWAVKTPVWTAPRLAPAVPSHRDPRVLRDFRVSSHRDPRVLRAFLCFP